MRKVRLARKILNRQKFWNLIGYKPTKNQLAIHNSTARFRINISGRRAGKSWSAAKEIEPWILSPGTRGWIVAPTYELADKIARIVKEDLLLKLKLPIAAKKEINGQLYYFKVAGLNSELWVKSADAPDSLIGEGIDFLVIDEAAAIKKIVWEQYLRPTLSDREGWCLMTTTPRGYNFVHSLWERGQSKEFPEWESWQNPSHESPYFKDDITELNRTLTLETYEQEYEARFTNFSGKCFNFSRSTHVIKGLKYNPDLPVYCSIDFGYRLSATGWFQIKQNEEGKDTIYQIAEICHEPNIKTEDLADRIRKKNYPVVAYYGDPAGGGVQSQSGIGDIEIFKRKGMIVRFKRDTVSRNVVNGVSHVRSWFEDADGNAHFFVSDKCKGSIDSYDNYRYPERKEDQRVKEEPLKDGRNDHACDMLRYFIVNLYPIKRRTAGVIDW